MQVIETLMELFLRQICVAGGRVLHLDVAAEPAVCAGGLACARLSTEHGRVPWPGAAKPSRSGSALLSACCRCLRCRAGCPARSLPGSCCCCGAPAENSFYLHNTYRIRDMPGGGAFPGLVLLQQVHAAAACAARLGAPSQKKGVGSRHGDYSATLKETGSHPF